MAISIEIGIKIIWQKSKFMHYKILFFVGAGCCSTGYGGYWARRQIRTTAGGLHHSHSNARSKPWLWPAPQLAATLDP